MERKTLQKQNEELQRTIRMTVRRIEHNETILKRFFDVELKLLACNKLSDLIALLLTDFKHTFKLSAVTLYLFDPDELAKNLLIGIPAAHSKALTLFKRQDELNELSPNSELQAGELSTGLRKLLFPDNPFVLSAAMLPLIRQDCLIGSLHLGAQDSDRYSIDYRYDYLSHLCSVISVCIENCINQESLQRLSTIDPLTGVHNRRAFSHDIAREINRAHRTQEQLSCLFVDIDHFKTINDNYGHQTGDRALRTLGNLLKEQFRKTDLISRYGGEEFAVLLPSCSEKEAVCVAENLRQAVEALIIRDIEGSPFRLTASIGTSTFAPALVIQKRDDKALRYQSELLLKQADFALYEAKRSGRNRVFSHALKAVRRENESIDQSVNG